MANSDPAASPRARRHDANLGKVVDTAIELVAANGLAALSMARLAAAVDYTPGALYRYFESKDALLAQVVARILSDLGTTLAKSVDAEAAPIERVVLLVRGYLRFARREPHRFGLLATALAEPRVLLAAAAHSTPAAIAAVAALTPLADALGAAVAADHLDAGDVIERTLCLFAMVHGLVQLPKIARHSPRAIDVDQLVESGIRALLLGWGGKPRAVDAAFEKRKKAR